MKKEEVFSPLATPPKGSYSQAIKITNINTVIFTGTITSLDEDWNVVGAGDIDAQVRKTIENLENILLAAGATLENIVKTTWYLTDIKMKPDVERVSNEMFKSLAPASSTIPINALYYDDLLLEMEAIVVL